MENNNKIPNDGIKGLLENWKSDSISGFLVFLIALPLSLGIAKASGFPPIAGIYTAIIGGIIVSVIMGSALTIKGPAAGLIVIAIGAVEELGQGDMFLGYQLALATIVIAGLIQVGFGLIKLGKYGDFFPSSVIHGMMASIGIIIFSKQIHLALGAKPSGKNPIELLLEIPNSIIQMNPEVAIIGFVSLFILFLMPNINHPIIKKIPAPLIVLGVAIPLGIFFNLSHEHDYTLGNVYHIDPAQVLVTLPNSFLSGITLPDFSLLFSYTSIKYIIMFALVGSIESLLSSKAIDLLDPFKRKSDLDRDLIAVGIGNTFAGFIGGLPMISEIVRSSANINNGAKTRWSNFFHGIFLLGFVVLASDLIQMIPIAALAGMLMFTGYRLASPQEFYKTYKIGTEQLIIFLITIIFTLATDLLLGVAMGLLTKFIIHLIWGVPLKAMFKTDISIDKINEEHYLIKIQNAAIFSNFMGFKKEFDKIPKGIKLDIDFSNTKVIDHAFMENLTNLESDFYNNGGEINIIGLQKHSHVSGHPLATMRLKSGAFEDVKQLLSPRQRELKVLANKIDFNFYPGHFRVNPAWKDFSYFKGKVILYGEDVLEGESYNHQINIVNLKMNDSSKVINGTIKLTGLYIKGFKGSLPVFKLQKEGTIEKLSETIKNTKDIDFEKFPIFSKMYYLHGADEDKIRNFFNYEIIHLLENNEGYYIESNGKEVLISYKYQFCDIPTTEMLTKFGNRFLEIICRYRKNQ
jgi:MFS superfamily sulfate permease-like transporter